MLDQQIQQVASRILAAGPSSTRLVDVAARSVLTLDGLPAVQVTARYRTTIDESGLVGLDAMHEIRNELLSQGDDRFVLLENEYLDEADPAIEDAE